MRRRNMINALSAGILASTLTLSMTPAASAVPKNLTEIDTEYTISENGSFAKFEPWVAGLDDKLPNASFADVLADGNRKAVDLCRDTGIVGATGFCWAEGDDDTPDWYPQGLSGSWDAAADGEYDGHRAMFGTWYSKGDKGVRVSLVNYDDPAKPTYRHILLVEPTSDDDFEQVKVHAGGVAWFGDYLYVVDTAKGVRVFDLRHLWKTEPDSSKKKIGKGDDGKYYAYNYAYVLPQVGAYSQKGDGKCDPAPVDDLDAPLCFSWVGLDRSTSPPSLLTGEFFYGKEKGARMARWPIDESTGRLAGDGGTVTANKAYQSPEISTQGGVSYDGTFLQTSSRGDSDRGYLYRAEVGQASTNSSVPTGIEDLSYESADKRAWTQTEYPGNRMVIGIPDAMG